MATKLKRGAISEKERLYIAENRDYPPEELAASMGRSVAFVNKALAALPTIEKKARQGDWVVQLHASSFWIEVKKGLIRHEIAFFERSWASYMSQFASNAEILATDELMIRDLIMLDILTQRAVNDKAKIIRQIYELEQEIEAELEKDREDRDDIAIGTWRTQLNALNAARNSISKEHIGYQDKKDAKLRDLKGSRDQRFKQIEESRRNIFELIKELDTQKARLREGRIAEKVRLASEHVFEDWNQVTEYEDGSLDKPYLSPEGELADEIQNE